MEHFPTVRTVRAFAAAVVCLALLLVMSAVLADARDYKPRQLALTTPVNGLYIDQAMPARYCVIESGQWGSFGQQAFLHCSAGYNNAGHTFVAPSVQVGSEYLLYRLQADGGLLTPVVINSVTITDATQAQITVRFGSLGAQSPAYVLTRQPALGGN